MDKRDFKTHPQQWTTIVDFGANHPTIFRPQFKQGDGDARQNAKLWEELANMLNSMGFGFRSIDKWKMAMGRWKSKTKSKAAQLRIEAQKTGPSNAFPLTETEERLMKLEGWKSITGEANAELGMGPIRPIVAHLPLPQPQPLTGQDNPLPPPEPQPSSTTETEGPAYSSKSPLSLTSSNGPTRKRSRLSTDKSRKYISLSKMHQEAMEERRKLKEIVRRQAEAQEATAQILKDFFAYYKKKDNNI